MIDSIKIIHDELRGGEYRLLADFFRLVGIHVCDCTLKTEELSTDYTFMIVISKGIEEADIQKLQGKYADKLIVLETLDSFTDPEQQRVYLEACLDLIYEKAYTNSMEEQGKEKRLLEAIAEIFVNYRLSYCRHVYSYFYESQELVQKAQDQMVDAYVSLMDKINKGDYAYLPYAIYTRMNLARYVNETCSFLNQSFLFDTKKCLEKIDKLLEIAPTFSNAYLLKAFFVENDIRHQFAAEAYYDIAMQQIGKKSYASYPIYRQGRYYEKILEDHGRAEELYHRAYETNNLEYRAVYKMILFAKKKGKYHEAVENCKKIANILKNKTDKNYLQPREYEYLFKAYLEMGKIYETSLMNEEERRKAIQKRNEVCALAEKSENEMYQQIFGAEAEKFLKLTSQRLKTTVTQCEQ